MKSWITIVSIIVALEFSYVSLVHAQSSGDIVDFLQTGKEDASKLTSAYINPMVEGLSYGMNGGWFHTAKAHKSLGFDLSITLNGVFVPNSQRYFKPDDLDLANTQLSPNDPDGRAPTVIGPEEGTDYETTIQTPDGEQTIPFSGPEGLDMKKRFGVQGVVVPMVQLGVGIYKNTDLKIRFAPETKIGDDGRIRMIGFGVLHDIKQHIPGLKIMPFDLAMMVGYTKVSGEIDLESGDFPPAQGDTDAQEMPFELNAWLVQALISKKVAVITFYGGIGYNAIKSSADIKGSYRIYQGANGDIFVEDPVSLNFKNKSFRVTAGFRLSLGGFFLTGNYSLQEYSSVTAGLGVTIR